MKRSVEEGRRGAKVSDGAAVQTQRRTSAEGRQELQSICMWECRMQHGVAPDRQALRVRTQQRRCYQRGRPQRVAPPGGCGWGGPEGVWN